MIAKVSILFSNENRIGKPYVTEIVKYLLAKLGIGYWNERREKKGILVYEIGDDVRAMDVAVYPPRSSICILSGLNID